MSFIEMILLIIVITIIATVVILIVNKKVIPNIRNNDDVMLILKRGDRIKAIKAYRQLHGVGLKEAKKYIDNCVRTNEKEI